MVMAGVDDVAELISKRFPGILLESPIQGWVYLEEFDKGILTYSSIEDPTAADDRWLGVCHFQKIEDQQALDAFTRAVEQGEEGARVNLAHLLQVSERADRASEELQIIDLARLRPYDQVFFFRVKSIHEENNGNLRESLRFAEEAWRRLQGLPEFEVLAPSILTQLGILHGRIGRAQRALWFLSRAIEMTEGLQQLKVRMRWATIVVAQGQMDEALAEVESWDLSQAPEPLVAEKHWLLAEIAWLRGKLADAIAEYKQSIAAAKQHQISYEEFLCRLALATLEGMNRGKDALEHLGRAQQLISDRSDRLAYRFREVLILHWQGLYGSGHAVQELLRLASDFGEMGLLQEQGWVRFHVAALRFADGDPQYAEDLDALHALALTLQNARFLRREAILQPTFTNAIDHALLNPDPVPGRSSGMHTAAHSRAGDTT